MRRRALLASIGALSAGCLGTSPPQGSTTTETPEYTERPTTTAAKRCEEAAGATATESTDETVADGEYRLTGLNESTSYDRPSVQYILEPTAFYSADAVEKEAERTGDEQNVTDITAVSDEAVRSAIETAIQSGEWRANTLPGGLAETVDRVDFFTGVSEDDTYTHIGVTLHRLHPDRQPAVAFSASIADNIVSKESPGVVEFELSNETQTTQYVSAGTIPPFGMVVAKPVEASAQFLLWRKYETEGCITFNDDGWLKCDIGTTIELDQCETIARRYEVLPDTTSHQPEHTVPPGPGTYRITDSVAFFEEPGAPESELSFEVQFSLEPL